MACENEEEVDVEVELALRVVAGEFAAVVVPLCEKAFCKAAKSDCAAFKLPVCTSCFS